jgi:hypothetical protein
MRRYLAALLIGCAAMAAWLPGAAASKGERVEERTYARPAGVWTSHFDEGMRSLPEETMTFIPKRGDRWIRFEFQDATGRDVLAHITQGTPHEPDGVTGVHPYSDGEIVCATRHSFRLHGMQDVQLRLYAGLCPNHTFGYATTGTVIATFARTG